MPSYWITHPDGSAFISAFSPEGVGQVLLIAERWPADRYLIREHRPRDLAMAGGDRPWGYALKDVAGDVLVQPSAEPHPA
jgi:hypothetical protein